MYRERYHRIVAVGAVLAALAFAPTSVRANQTLEEAMEKVAKGISGQLRRAGAETVSVGIPDGPATDAAGSEMRSVFVEALKKHAGVEVSDLIPDFKLSLEYTRSRGTPIYSGEVTLKDSENQSVGKFPVNFRIEAAQDRAKIEGSTFDSTLAADGTQQPATEENINNEFASTQSAAVEPSPGVPEDKGGAPPAVQNPPGQPPAQSVVRGQAASNFGIEILVKTDQGYVPRAVATRKGFAFTEVNVGETYGVRVFNGADHAVAVDLSIDGVNMWALSKVEGFRALGKFIVPPQSSTIIKGWHTGDAATVGLYEEFTVVLIPDSVVAELGVGETQVGQVSAQFFAASQSSNGFPPTEPLGAQEATGRGAPVEVETKVEPWFIGKSLLAAVTVRYARPRNEPSEDLPPPN